MYELKKLKDKGVDFSKISDEKLKRGIEVVEELSKNYTVENKDAIESDKIFAELITVKYPEILKVTATKTKKIVKPKAKAPAKAKKTVKPKAKKTVKRKAKAPVKVKGLVSVRINSVNYYDFGKKTKSRDFNELTNLFKSPYIEISEEQYQKIYKLTDSTKSDFVVSRGVGYVAQVFSYGGANKERSLMPVLVEKLTKGEKEQLDKISIAINKIEKTPAKKKPAKKGKKKVEKVVKKPVAKLVKAKTKNELAKEWFKKKGFTLNSIVVVKPTSKAFRKSYTRYITGITDKAVKIGSKIGGVTLQSYTYEKFREAFVKTAKEMPEVKVDKIEACKQVLKNADYNISKKSTTTGKTVTQKKPIDDREVIKKRVGDVFTTITKTKQRIVTVGKDKGEVAEAKAVVTVAEKLETKVSSIMQKIDKLVEKNKVDDLNKILDLLESVLG